MTILITKDKYDDMALTRTWRRQDKRQEQYDKDNDMFDIEDKEQVKQASKCWWPSKEDKKILVRRTK